MKLSFQSKTAGIGSTWASRSALLADEEIRLFLVACGSTVPSDDGAFAAPLAVETITNYLRQNTNPEWPFRVELAPKFTETKLRAALNWANHTLSQKVEYEEREWEGFLSSVAALWLRGDSLFISHCGDCRVYRMRAQQLEALTQDHSYREEVRQHGKLTDEELSQISERPSRRLGYGKELPLSVLREKTRAGDTFLLCTEGIHRNINDEELATILREEDLSFLCERLVERCFQEPLWSIAMIVVRCG